MNKDEYLQDYSCKYSSLLLNDNDLQYHLIAVIIKIEVRGGTLYERLFTDYAGFWPGNY